MTSLDSGPRGLVPRRCPKNSSRWKRPGAAELVSDPPPGRTLAPGGPPGRLWSASQQCRQRVRAESTHGDNPPGGHAVWVQAGHVAALIQVNADPGPRGLLPVRCRGAPPGRRAGGGGGVPGRARGRQGALRPGTAWSASSRPPSPRVWIQPTPSVPGNPAVASALGSGAARRGGSCFRRLSGLVRAGAEVVPLSALAAAQREAGARVYTGVAPGVLGPPPSRPGGEGAVR